MAVMKDITLYSFFYSSASWRIRSVLAVKKIPFTYECVHLINGGQHEDGFLKVNPMHQAPAIKFSDEQGKVHTLTQSLAIINLLDRCFPENPVYPADPILRAKADAIADTISGGIQPLQNLETLTKYHEPIGAEPYSPDQRKKIAQYWITRKLANLEKLVKMTSGKYCVGDQVTIADISLVPQMFNARRFEVDTSPYPTLKEIDARLQELDMFKVSHPYNCPDTPDNLKQKN